MEPLYNNVSIIGPTCIEELTYYWQYYTFLVVEQCGNSWVLGLLIIGIVLFIGLCMGQSASSAYKKTARYISGSDPPPIPDGGTVATPRHVILRERRSSLRRDEDDDIAHEFYEEHKFDGGLSIMRRVFNTIPVGLVKLDCPSLNPDYSRVILPNDDIMSKFNNISKDPCTTRPPKSDPPRPHNKWDSNNKNKKRKSHDKF